MSRCCGFSANGIEPLFPPLFLIPSLNQHRRTKHFGRHPQASRQGNSRSQACRSDSSPYRSPFMPPRRRWLRTDPAGQGPNGGPPGAEPPDQAAHRLSVRGATLNPLHPCFFFVFCSRKNGLGSARGTIASAGTGQRIQRRHTPLALGKGELSI